MLWREISRCLLKESKSTKNHSTRGNENPCTAANLYGISHWGMCARYPRLARTRFIGAWPSFGKVSWVNCKCFRQRTSPRWLPFTTGGEFVYASWLPTWERQHGARHGLKRTNRLGLNAASRLFCPSVGRFNVMACSPSVHLRSYPTQMQIDQFQPFL